MIYNKIWVFRFISVFTLNVICCPILLAAYPTTSVNAASYEACSAAVNAINNKMQSIDIKQSAHADETVANDTLKTFGSQPLIFGSLQTQKSLPQDDIIGYKTKTGGIGYMIDNDFKEYSTLSLDTFQLGAGLTYTDSHVKFDNNNTTRTDTGQILGYANLIKNNFYLSVYLSESHNWHKSKRPISSTNFESYARYQSEQFFSKFRLGYMARGEIWQLTPETFLQYINIHQRAYHESGGGAADLSQAPALQMAQPLALAQDSRIFNHSLQQKFAYFILEI